jgi:hypothetical protein
VMIEHAKGNESESRRPLHLIRSIKVTCAPVIFGKYRALVKRREIVYWIAKRRRVDADNYSRAFFRKPVLRLNRKEADRLFSILVFALDGSSAGRLEIVEQSGGFSLERRERPERASAHGRSFGMGVVLRSAAQYAMRCLV